MSYYIVTNETSSDVFLEDIGIRLNGRGATATVSKTDFELSKSVKFVGRAISAKYVGSSVWPFSIPKPVEIPAPKKHEVRQQISKLIQQHLHKPAVQSSSKPQPQPQPQPVQYKQPESVNNVAVTQLINKLDKLVSVVEPLLTKLEIGVVPVSQSSNVQVQPTLTRQIHDEPVFIPKEIVPTNVDARVNFKTGETDSIDESAEALKKLRKKQK